MAKGKLRKDNLSIKLEDGTIMNAERDNTAFRKTFQDWENMAKGLSGETIGNLRSPNSLYDMFKEQGISGRVMGNSGPKNRNKGGPEIFKMIRKIKSSRAYSTMELEYLETLDKLMDEYAKPDSEMNPANISFENPTDWTEKGTVTSTNTVYGHYRTEDYQDNRADKVSKDFPEGQDVPAVNSTWYAESEGEAKPPFWQAIYGDGTGDAFTGNSLHLCIKEAIEGFNNLEYEVSKKTPINFAKLGAWQKALQIDGISDIVKEWLEKPNRNGNFSSKLCLNEIVKTEHSMEGNESEVVKNIMQMPGMKQDIKKIWVSMARRQVLNMAYNLANKSNIPVHWTDSGKNVLKFGEKVDPQKKKPKKKDSMKKMLKGGSSNMSWKAILKNEEIDDRELRNYLDYLIMSSLNGGDDSGDLSVNVEGYLSNSEFSPQYSYDHKEAQNGVWVTEAYGGHESGTNFYSYYRNGKKVSPIPMPILLRTIGMTRNQAEASMKEDLEDGSYEPRWDEGQFYGQGSAYY